MLELVYPDVSNIEVIATQPKPADLRSMAYLQATENTTFDNVSYIVKINLSRQLPATSFGFQLYVGDQYVREYRGFKDGIYLKINNPRFFAENSGQEIRFSLDGGLTFYNTGVFLPGLAGEGRRRLRATDSEALPTQEDVLQ